MPYATPQYTPKIDKSNNFNELFNEAVKFIKENEKIYSQKKYACCERKNYYYHAGNKDRWEDYRKRKRTGYFIAPTIFIDDPNDPNYESYTIQAYIGEWEADSVLAKDGRYFLIPEIYFWYKDEKTYGSNYKK